MEKHSTEKKSFFKRKAMWAVILLALIFWWQFGLVLLAVKLMDMWQERKSDMPAEAYLSYSAAKTAAENEAAANRERSLLRALRAAKFLIPLLVLLGIAMVVQGCQSHSSLLLFRGILCLTLALICGLYFYQYDTRNKRIRCYKEMLGKQNAVSLAHLAQESGVAVEDVAQDLQYMMDRQFFSRNARLDLEQKVLYQNGRN
ncbi:MAG: hypothetical protein EOM66_09610 [Clostridia bacterium]|nr:hypothetical protein [Clostridia bacterium]